jgi:hypothetical protein
MLGQSTQTDAKLQKLGQSSIIIDCIPEGVWLQEVFRHFDSDGHITLMEVCKLLSGYGAKRIRLMKHPVRIPEYASNLTDAINLDAFLSARDQVLPPTRDQSDEERQTNIVVGAGIFYFDEKVISRPIKISGAGSTKTVLRGTLHISSYYEDDEDEIQNVQPDTLPDCYRVVLQNLSVKGGVEMGDVEHIGDSNHGSHSSLAVSLLGVAIDGRVQICLVGDDRSVGGENNRAALIMKQCEIHNAPHEGLFIHDSVAHLTDLKCHHNGCSGIVIQGEYYRRSVTITGAQTDIYANGDNPSDKNSDPFEDTSYGLKVWSGSQAFIQHPATMSMIHDNAVMDYGRMEDSDDEPFGFDDSSRWPTISIVGEHQNEVVLASSMNSSTTTMKKKLKYWAEKEEKKMKKKMKKRKKKMKKMKKKMKKKTK